MAAKTQKKSQTVETSPDDSVTQAQDRDHSRSVATDAKEEIVAKKSDSKGSKAKTVEPTADKSVEVAGTGKRDHGADGDGKASTNKLPPIESDVADAPKLLASTDAKTPAKGKKSVKSEASSAAKRDESGEVEVPKAAKTKGDESPNQDTTKGPKIKIEPRVPTKTPVVEEEIDPEIVTVVPKVTRNGPSGGRGRGGPAGGRGGRGRGRGGSVSAEPTGDSPAPANHRGRGGRGRGGPYLTQAERIARKSVVNARLLIPLSLPIRTRVLGIDSLAKRSSRAMIISSLA